MRFFHLSDLHFGKQLYHLSLLEDQAEWVEEFLKKCDEVHPDAVVIAGDVYDRRLPPPEAVTLLDSFLTCLAEREIPVLMIAGNHDSRERLSFCRDILKNSRIHIEGEVRKQIRCVTLRDQEGPIHFWLLPFLFPKLVEAVLEEGEYSGYEEAMASLLKHQKINPEERNVLVTHQNVMANGVHTRLSGSESLVGGVGEMDCSLFDVFDYVAMGHIHMDLAVGRPEVRYAGCPLYYDFSECGHRKDLTLVELGEKGNVRTERIPIPLTHRMERVRGNFQQVLAQGKERKDLNEVYFQILLTDEHLPAQAAERLREVYGNNLLNISRDVVPALSACAREDTDSLTIRGLGLQEQFSRFYSSMSGGELLNGNQDAILCKILEQQSRNEYCSESGKVPEVDTAELLALLMAEEERE